MDQVELWSSGTVSEIKESPLFAKPLSSHQILEMLSKLLERNAVFDSDKMALLAGFHNIGATKNAEIRFYYLRMCIRAKQLEQLPAIFAFADSSFRMKFVRPIYKELGQWSPEVRQQAIDHFRKVKDQMMKMVSILIAKDLGIF